MLYELGKHNGVPLCYDETTISSGISKSDFIYIVSQGSSKKCLDTQRKLKERDTWLCTTLFSSETDLIDYERDNLGLLVRIINLDGLTYTKSSEHSEQIKTFTSSNYGIIGEMLSEWLLKADPTEVAQIYEDARAALKCADGLCKCDLTDRMIANHAVILATGMILMKMGLALDIEEIKAVSVTAMNTAARYADRGKYTPKFRLYYPKQGESEVPIMETTNKYLDLSGAISLSKSVAAKAITIVNTKQGVRTRLSAQFWKDLGKPEQIEVFLLDDNVVITEAHNPDNALPVGEKRYIYSTGLAKRLAELADVDFKARNYHDYTKAAQYFQRAVEHDFVEGYYMLGMCYSEGYGVPKDKDKAKELLQVAADNGHTEAQNYINNMIKTEGYIDTAKKIGKGALGLLGAFAQGYIQASGNMYDDEDE